MYNPCSISIKSGGLNRWTVPQRTLFLGKCSSIDSIDQTNCWGASWKTIFKKKSPRLRVSSCVFEDVQGRPRQGLTAVQGKKGLQLGEYLSPRRGRGMARLTSAKMPDGLDLMLRSRKELYPLDIENPPVIRNP